MCVCLRACVCARSNLEKRIRNDTLTTGSFATVLNALSLLLSGVTFLIGHRGLPAANVTVPLVRTFHSLIGTRNALYNCVRVSLWLAGAPFRSPRSDQPSVASLCRRVPACTGASQHLCHRHRHSHRHIQIQTHRHRHNVHDTQHKCSLNVHDSHQHVGGR